MRGNKASPHSSQCDEAEEGTAAEVRILFVGAPDSDVAHLKDVLGRAGCRSAWKIVSEAPPDVAAFESCDLVLADGDCAGCDCHAMVRMARAAHRDLPFLVLSADCSEQRAIAAVEAGVDDWIEKERVEEQLPAALERAMAAAKGRREARRAAEAEAEETEVLHALSEVAFELIAAWGTRTLFERLGQVSIDVLKCDLSSTLMMEAGGEAFGLAASHGWTAEEEEISRFVRAPRSVVASLLDRLVATEDVVELKTNPLASVLPAPHAQLTHLFTALRQEGAIVGIQIFSRRAGSPPFRRTDRRIAAGISELASLSLTHAKVIDELERVHHVKSDFVATVSHELRTPLHIVMGYTDLLVDGAFGALSDEQVQALQRIRQRARGLLELINATLDLNRLEAGHFSLDIEPVDLSAVMERLYRETRESEDNPNVRLIWDVPERLPVIWTDAAKLKVALKNLIANALKFTDRGSVTVRVETNESEVKFTVADTGVGIAPEALPIVFEAFRQADSSSTRRFGGVGLGLYIVRRLLDLLNGQVEVESELGRGSTFRVRLPRTGPRP